MPIDPEKTPLVYVDLAAAVIRLPIPPQHREGVARHVEAAATMVRPLLEFELGDSVEPAPVFEP